MKIMLLIIMIHSLLLSKVYYAKVEPFEIRDISSNVSGLVLFIDEDMIGKKLSSKAYIKIDSELDRKELKYIEEKLIYLKNIVKSNEKVLKNLETLLGKKRDNYKKIKSLKIKSTVEKDREYYDLIGSENIYLNTVKDINNLRVQIADLNLRKAQLTRSVSDKNLNAKDFVLYSIAVRPGQVVGISASLARIADTSRAKLTIFLDEVDLIDINSKQILLNGKASKYKVSRVLNIADSKNISKYMAQIIIDAPKVFSKLIKVEFK